MTDQTPEASAVPMWHDRRTIAEIIHEYGYVRGDLTEQYARDQLTAIIESRVAAARADERARVLGEVEARANQMDAGKPGVIGWFPDPTADAVRRILRDLREQGGGR